MRRNRSVYQHHEIAPKGRENETLPVAALLEEIAEKKGSGCREYLIIKTLSEQKGAARIKSGTRQQWKDAYYAYLSRPMVAIPADKPGTEIVPYSPDSPVAEIKE